MISKHLALAGALLLSALWVGCGDDDDNSNADPHGELAPECDAILDACHPKDLGTGEVHTCHEGAEDNGKDWCAAHQTACIATCNAVQLDAGAD